MKRYLITTADERSWAFDRPVLFLGEWCRLYDRKRIWGQMDAVVAEPYGLGVGEKERDLGQVQAVSRRLLGEVADALNSFHGTRHSERYWHIVLGHWLNRHVAVCFNRYFTLQQALTHHEVSGTAVLRTSSYSLATTDSLAYIWATFDDIWNHVLYARILDFLGDPKIQMDAVPVEDLRGFVQEQSPIGSSVRHRVRDAAGRFLLHFNTRRSALIINTYLPLSEELKLHLSLGQCPQLSQSPPLEEVAPDPEKRRGFSIDAEGCSGFERFVRVQVSDTIPSCYLEGYGRLVRQVETLKWPAQPRFVYTSNSFDTDEVFKAWVGQKVEQGVPYITGQHGNNYGTLIGNDRWPELVTSDKFITWGWSNESPKNVPAFVFKVAGRLPPSRHPDGGLLLIEFYGTHRLSTEDTYYQLGVYQEEQFRFVAALRDSVHERLTVRIHPSYRLFRWCEEQRWQDRSPHTRLETKGAPIFDLMAKSRLVVHAYDSTGILETLAWNIPTMCFWHGGLEHLVSSAKPYYEILRSAGILLDGPEQAAEAVGAHWDDVGEWWDSGAVQVARKEFCARYARIEARPVRTLKRLLLRPA